MKRLFILLAIIASMAIGTANAQTYAYRTTAFAMKQINSYGNWSNWSDWEKSDMLITINLDTDVIKIYSPMTQIYQIIKYVGSYQDSSGGTQVEYKFVDQDDDIGTLRLRKERNGNIQIYVDFSNIMWVYNVVKINL